jgi:hypothetical protein
MPTKRHKPEEIVAKLRQVDVLTSQGQSVAAEDGGGLTLGYPPQCDFPRNEKPIHDVSHFRATAGSQTRSVVEIGLNEERAYARGASTVRES